MCHTPFTSLDDLPSDKTIIALRKLLLAAVRALQDGGEAPHVVRDPLDADFSRLRSIKGILPAGTDWHKVMEGMGPNDA